MKFSTLIFSFVFTLSLSVQAQLKGTLIDQNNQPIEFANIALYSLPDSVMVTGAVSDVNGAFSLNGNGTEKAFIEISFIGYETKTAPATTEQTIMLNAESLTLGEVVIKGDLPKIRLKNDALVTTVQNSVLSKAGTANDVLKRLPSLTGDEGQFSVFGKGEAKIYINNREMRDVSELDNLSSADIKEVEIVNNPGARYDASVKAVIRIITVRKVGDGFSFDVRSSYWQSRYINLAEQFNVNYRKNGWDIFGTLKYEKSNLTQYGTILQNTYVDTLWTQDNTINADVISHSMNSIVGVNYEISPKHYIGMRYTHATILNSNWFSEFNSKVYANGVFYDKLGSLDDKKLGNDPTHRLNAYYNGSFGDLNIDFNTDFFRGESFSNSTMTESSQEFDDRVIKSSSSENNRLLATKLVLSYPVLGGHLSAGGEYTDTHRNDEYINDQSFVPSSKTTINEKNNSLFAEYSRQTPIGQFGAGMRYENVSSEYFVNDAKNEEQSRRYDQWFPNFSFSTKIKDTHLQLSYTAKTQRPSYRQLSSNVFYGNRFTLQTGNPFLKPSIIHDVTMVGAWKFMNLMVSYKEQKDAIIISAEQLEENSAITLLGLRNEKTIPNLSAFITASPTFGFWSPQASVGFMKQWLTIESTKGKLVLDKPISIASLNNSFSLPKGYIITLDMNFLGKGDIENVNLYKNKYVVNVGITKSFLDDQLHVAIKGSDIFKGQREGNHLHTNQMDLYQINRYDSRKVELTVRYKFNSAKSKYKGTGAGQKEINRL